MAYSVFAMSECDQEDAAYLLATVIPSQVYHHFASCLLVVAVCNSSPSANLRPSPYSSKLLQDGATSVIDPSSNL